MAEPFEKIDLPSGGWVALRDPKALTRGQRKPLDRARQRLGLARNLIEVLEGKQPAGDLADSDVGLLEGIMEAVAFVLIDSWSFDVEPSVVAFDDLSPEDYDALIAAAAEHRGTLIPDFEPGPREDEQGRENPTGLSPESKKPSEVSPSPESSPPMSSEPGGS